MKFDYTVGNPPYAGTSALHQRIFNKCVNLLTEDGEIVFIQPATALFNKKTNQKEQNLLMQENITKYKTDIKVVPGTIFKGANIVTDLMITTLTKTESEQKTIDSLTYKDDSVHKNIDLKYINKTNIEPKMYESILMKYKKYIDSNGSLLDISALDKKIDTNKKYISIAQIRGHIDSEGQLKPDFYTLFSREDTSKTKNNIVYGLECKQGEETNMYHYLSSNVARFGLSFLKMNNNNHRGEIVLIPIFDFSKKYTDEELYNVMEFTNTEIKIIEDVIKPWNHLGEQ